MRSRTLAVLAATLCISAAATADVDATCSKSAAANFSLPPRAPACTEDGQLACADGKPGCAASAEAYAKLLQRKLPAAWWSTPAEQIQACRTQKVQADPDHAWAGLAQSIEGSERIRLLVPGNSCDSQTVSAGYDVALVVKSDRGLVVKFLAENYYDPHEDDPYSLALTRNGADNLALVSVRGHDMHEMSTVTTAYKVDLVSGAISEYPLFMDAKGPSSRLESSEPTLNFDEDESSALVANGKLAEHFTRYGYLEDCPEDGDCAVDQVASKTRYAWNGSAYAVDKSGAAPRADRGKLAAHRQCLKAKFDAKTGTADCPGDFADNCESNNDLSFLNYKAGNLDRARDYAAKALDECKSDPKQLAAAQFNDRRARGR